METVRACRVAAWASLLLSLIGALSLWLAGGRWGPIGGALSPLQLLLVTFGPGVGLAGLALILYLRLDASERGQARIAVVAAALTLGVPLALALLYVIAMASMGNV